MDNPVRGTGIYKHVTFTLQFDRRYMPLFTIASMNIQLLSIHISMNMSTLLAASSPVWKASLWDGKGHMKSLKLLYLSQLWCSTVLLSINDGLQGLTCHLGQYVVDNYWPKPIELHINAAKEVLFFLRGFLVNGSCWRAMLFLCHLL